MISFHNNSFATYIRQGKTPDGTSCLHRRTRNLENIPERRGRILVCGSGCRRLSLRLRDDGGLRCLCGTGGLDGAALLSGGGCWEDLRSSDGDVHSGCGPPARSSFSFDAGLISAFFSRCDIVSLPGTIVFGSRGKDFCGGTVFCGGVRLFYKSFTPDGDGTRHSLAFFWNPTLRGVLKSYRDPADDVCGHIGISWTWSVLFINIGGERHARRRTLYFAFL